MEEHLQPYVSDGLEPDQLCLYVVHFRHQQDDMLGHQKHAGYQGQLVVYQHVAASLQKLMVHWLLGGRWMMQYCQSDGMAQQRPARNQINQQSRTTT